VDRLYAPRTLGGRGLLSVQDTVSIEVAAIAGGYLSSVKEPLLKAVQDYGWFPLAGVEQPSVNKSNLLDNHFNLWKSKPLHGQFLRDVQGDMDITWQWSWLTSGSLMPEIEGFILAAQDQAITTNALRCNIFHLPVLPSCRLCGRHDETIDHLISGCEVIA